VSSKPTHEALQQQLSAAQETIAALRKRMHHMENGNAQLPFQKQLQSYQQRIAQKANALEEVRNWSALIVHHSMDAIIRIDQQGVIQSWNPMAERMFGYRAAEARGMLMEDILIPRRLHGAYLKHFYRHLQRRRGALMNRRVEGIAQCKDGSELPVEFVGSYVQQGDQPVFVMVLRDISDRKAAEQQLRDSHANLESLVALRTGEVRDQAAIIEATLNMVSMADLDGNVLYINPAGKNILGLAQDQPLHAMKIGRFHSPEAEQMLVQDVLPKTLQQGICETECEFLDADANPVPMACIFMSLADQDGHPSRIAVIGRDLRKEIAMQHQLEHVDRLESLGVLAGGIAHDFNNILTAIMGHAGMAQIKLDSRSPVQKYLQGIEQSSQQAANLCKQMLAYSGKGTLIIEPVDLSSLIDDMRSLLDVSITKNIILNFHLSDTLPALDGDITQIQQIILNLVINASEAINQRSGVITVSTGVMEVDKAYLQASIHQPEVATGRYVYLEVSDSGCGMDAATRKKIFDPFFTTKFTGRGLGMSAVLGIVHGHSGLLNLYSEPEKGTTFKIAFPTSGRGDLPASEENKAAPLQRVSGLILVIDDEESIREVASIVLADMGFEVITAVDGKDGVAVFRQYQQEVTGVLLDMTMPRMNGEECFRALRQINPDIKVILSSGYSAEDATAQFHGKDLAGFIQKPYLIGTFQDTVSTCFSGVGQLNNKNLR